MASSSSSSITAGSSTYDVFLSFRGEDIRNSFISFLHRALKDRGINVFLDSKNLWTGESIGPTLLAAIRGSKISIPVFSQRYAESKWCLKELAQIVEWQKSSGQLVLPIFFYVDPSDVRNQKKGSFARAFKKHERLSEPHEVKCWRDALNEIGNLKGEVVNDTTDQAELVELVVKRVLGELCSKTRLAESKDLIGINSPVNDLLFLLDLDRSDVEFVGIWGIGGIGKTTIARAVYNRIISTFSKHSFISDVGEQAMSSMGLVSLQQQLLKDILRLDNIDISNCDIGKQLIKERLCKEKVLIVLDNVDSAEQIDALVGGINWFGEGSRIVITTRDKEILSDAKVAKDKIYKPRELNHVQSLHLFSLHAFSSELPPENFMHLSNVVAGYSGGLPLTLEVFGSLLSKSTSIEEWKSTIQYLKEIPPEKVKKRLRISYDKLEGDYEKEIFLDVACFFIGRERKGVTPIWEAYGYHPMFAISRLIQRSLIKFEDEYYAGIICSSSVLKMHDQIRDMGRDIVLEENRTDPSKRSRLWSGDEILQVLEGKTGTIMAKGMVIDYSLSDVYLDQEHFDMMPNLKFFEICSSRVKGNFWRLPSTLRWFKWRDCPWEFIPRNFYHKGLMHLELEKSMIKQAWNISPSDENKRFLKLKVLNLCYSQNLSLSPNFSWFPNLEQLDLSRCKSLEKLDESIGQLSQLQTLNLNGCKGIMELPNSICNLRYLVKLNLSWTGIKELPNNLDVGIEEVSHSVGLSENLEELYMSNCSRPVELPRSMGRLRRLRTLDLSGTKISKLSGDFSTLSNLEELRMSWNLKSFPIDLSHFKKLRILEFAESELLEELPEASSSLVELRLYKCSSLIRTLNFSRLRHLKVLDLWYCEKLKEIQGLDEGAKFLDEITVMGCPYLINTKRNIHGQGTLLLPEMSQMRDYRLCADSTGLILCVVLKPMDYHMRSQLRYFSFEIEAMIHQKDKATKCRHTLIFEDVEFTSKRDVICIHHFKGFDWFGIPLQEKDSIVIHLLRLTNLTTALEVKFWKLLQGSWQLDPQKPMDQYLSAHIVADFFNWYDGQEEEEEEEEEEGPNHFLERV